jgi:outer membrane lipoprotein-sorting protein
VFETGGKKISSTVTTDFKLNAEIPADRFAFKAPAGVEMMDLTKQPGK